MDNACKGHYVWCSTGELFNALEVKNCRLTAGPKKDCLAFEVDTKRKRFNVKDEVCNLNQKFVCEPSF
jgi:hypothetical protein